MFYGYLYVVTSLLFGLATGCSINVTKTSGNLTSPNYPKQYSRNMDCEYVIMSPTKQPITLVFDDFEVEDNSDCKHDYVSVKDGDHTLLGMFCGHKNPLPLLALSGVVIIKFHSDQSVSRKGFLAVFDDSQECVYVKKDSNGSIQSPNFPAIYPLEILCLYYIESVNRIPINMTFISFDLEYSSSGTCDNDYIMAQDGISKTAKRLGTFCGKEIPFIPVVLTGTVFLIFKSNNLVSRPGFTAEYKEESFLDCSGYLNVLSGRIQSPNYPESYSKNTDCEYRIVSPYINESSINLTFSDFELEEKEDCGYDFVEIYDLNKRIGRFCGTQNPVLTFTLSSSIRVVFHSDAGRNFKGFYATFTQITVYQTTEKLLSTLSFSTMSNTTFTPSLNSASVNSVVIGGATGVIIGFVVVIVIVCVMIGRQRRTEKNQLGRKCSENQSLDSSGRDNYSMENIDRGSTANSDEYRMANGKTNFGTEIHVYANDTEMNKEVIVNDEVNNEYSYTSLLTDDTSKNKHHADYSYYDLSENYNEVDENQKFIESGKFEGETNSSEYIDNEEAYNILNINPQKINDTENFDRTIEDVYDETTYNTNTSHSDLGLYDLSSNNKLQNKC